MIDHCQSRLGGRGRERSREKQRLNLYLVLLAPKVSKPDIF